tara:strand:- start:1268 stop:2656 length:1389 start_codon:yes stop_codon:yes gene_type:complete
MNIDSVEKAEIFPLNPPANGSYSFKGGFPIIQFQIANQDKLLNTGTLRLNGTLRVQAPGASADTLIHPTNVSGGAAATNGISLNSRVGVASCIGQITLATQQNQTLEVVRSYGRYLASVMGVTHSQSDFDLNNSIGNPASASRSFNGARAVNNDVEFSIPLRTGLLQSGAPIPLGNNGLRGMLINLELSPDSNVLSGYSTYDDAGAETKQLFTPIGTGAFYQLRNLSLTYDLLVPDDSGKSQMSTPATGNFVYNSLSHLYGVLNSSDQTTNYNLGTANTLSVFHNFLPTTNINNFNNDGFSTGRLFNSNGGAYDQVANINRVTFIRGGAKFPLDYAIECEEDALRNRPQTNLDERYIDSIKPLESYNHSLISLNTNNGIPTETGFQLEETPSNRNTQTEPKSVFGAGIQFDPLTRSGVNFKNTNYALRLQSNLDGQSPNSIFTYVLAKNTLTYSPQGIMVQT